ncbi:hypothetical protein BH10PSE5_BH10PSE5_02700 [soil metagenome]
MTAFSDRDYDVYVVLGGEAPPPWQASVWDRVSGALAHLVHLSRGVAAVRTDQLGGMPPKMKPISFGRIGFDAKGAEKWTHSFPGQLNSGSPALFLGAELWAPPWTVCEKEQLAPDVYFGMSNERWHHNDAFSGQFNSVLLLAVAKDLQCTAVAEVAVEIGHLVGARLIAHEQRPWGRRLGLGGSYTNAINDLTVTGLFAPGPRHDRPADIAMLQGEWELVRAKV